MKLFLAIGMLAALLCGCGSDPTTTASPSPAATSSTSDADPVDEVTPSQPPDTAAATDILFLALVRAEAPNLALIEDDQVIALGQAICGDYDKGLSTQAIGAQMVTNGRGDVLDADLKTAVAQAGYIIGVATDSYCPQHNGK